MKKLLFFALFLILSTVGKAQDVDNFEVGPYEVEYKGTGDYRFRLRKGVNLYEYFDLKKDTVVKVQEQVAEPPSVEKAWQTGLELGRRVWGFGINDATDLTLFAQYKMAIGKDVYFGAGLSATYQANKATGTYIIEGKTLTKNSDNTLEANIFELGIPLSIEYAKLKKHAATPFIGLTVTPLFSTTMSQKIVNKYENLDGSHGLRIDPKLELGAYIPMGDYHARIGLFIRKGLSLSSSSSDNYDLKYGDRTTRVSIGGNISILF